MLRETLSYFKRSLGYVYTILLCDFNTVVLSCAPLLVLILSSIFGVLGALLILSIGYKIHSI